MRSAPADEIAAAEPARVTRLVSRTHQVAIVVLLLLAYLQMLWYRRALNPDGVAYLDLSDEVLAGQWHALVQGYWSPFYPVLLAAARALAGRDALHETLVAHGVTFAGFAFALVAWRALLVQLGRRSLGVPSFASPLGLVAGYAVFAWAMLGIVTLRYVTPDTWLAGWIFAAAALALRLGDSAQPRHAVALGVVLGAGYLTKSVLLPVAAAFLAVAVLLLPAERRAAMVARALGALILMAAPWITAISLHEGRATFGDPGRYTFAWYVSGDRWLSPDPTREVRPGAAVYPRVHETPAAYAWPKARGTYSPWSDPSAWHGAMPVNVGAASVVHQLRDAALDTARWLEPWVLVMVLVCVARASWGCATGREALSLALVALVGLGGYAMVHVEGRLVAPFLALAVLGGVAALRDGPSTGRRVASVFAAGLLVWVLRPMGTPDAIDIACGLLAWLVLVKRGARPHALAPIAGAAIIAVGIPPVVFDAGFQVSQLVGRQSMVDEALEVRTALKAELIPEGRRIGIIGDGPHSAIWAREVRARIVAEVPESQAQGFWSAPDSVRASVAQAMRAAGAEEIIATAALPDSTPPGWHRIPDVRVMRYPLVEP